jgi:hypothetical protein
MFKKGDIVECIDRNALVIKYGKQYVVLTDSYLKGNDQSNYRIDVMIDDGSISDIYDYRFKLVGKEIDFVSIAKEVCG